jgi:phosphofructokinase-like protein
LKLRTNPVRYWDMKTKNEIKTIGVLTGGGDCPGLNAVIRAVVYTARNTFGWKVIGIRDAFEGLLKPDTARELHIADVKNILHEGGTILGTTNKGDPFKYEVKKKGKLVMVDNSEKILKNVKKLGLDCIVSIGGDGTQAIAQKLYEKGLKVVAVPKTIDNDLSATDVTFGFNSAVRTATEAIDKLHTTAYSHHRVMVIELMGRYCGWIALHAGMAGDAHVILIPEIPFSMESVSRALKRRMKKGDRYSIVVVAEGAAPKDGKLVVQETMASGIPRLGGVGNQVSEAIKKMTGLETRTTVLGHLQRGGSPTEFDRVLATRYGESAVHLIANGHFGHMVALHGTAIKPVLITEAIGKMKTIFPRGTLVQVARSMGISFGD